MSEKKHLPRKRFGQHFLTDSSILNRIVATLSLGKHLPDGTLGGMPGGMQILEVGPGLGALTDGLVAALEKHGASLTVVEIDRDLVARLQRRYATRPVKVIEADILNFRLVDAATPDNPDQQFRVVGNLPYNITTPLIFHLLEQIGHIHDMLFMLQKEVAVRLCASPGNKSYGRLSVMTALALNCEMLFDVPPEAFDPPPKVNSTVMHLTPKKQPLIPRDRQTFVTIVAAAFNQRRKTLRNSLSEVVQSEHFTRADIAPSLRAEALSVEQYIALADVVFADR